MYRIRSQQLPIFTFKRNNPTTLSRRYTERKISKRQNIHIILFFYPAFSSQRRLATKAQARYKEK
jgi:hypothetical protein